MEPGASIMTVEKRWRQDHTGFTLLEVLIAVLILSIGLLGLASLQANGLRSNFSSYARSQAVILANDMADRIRANPVQAAAPIGAYNNIAATTGDPGCLLADCTPAQMVSHDIATWYTNLQNTLPQGSGTIVGNGTVFTISVMWDDNRDGAVGAGCGAAVSATEGCFSTTFIP
jgi:type IV pilus assembly protein PilV